MIKLERGRGTYHWGHNYTHDLGTSMIIMKLEKDRGTYRPTIGDLGVEFIYTFYHISDLYTVYFENRGETRYRHKDSGHLFSRNAGKKAQTMR